MPAKDFGDAKALTRHLHGLCGVPRFRQLGRVFWGHSAYFHFLGFKGIIFRNIGFKGIYV